ncbi:Ig-like domain-containing protein [bacterium]|nr:Ig-like domain-containing protein [bacterium]
MRKAIMVVLMFMIAAVLLVLSGCGGGSSAVPGKGDLKITVTFPPQPEGVSPEAIPVATNSFRIRISDPVTGDPLAADVVISRAGGVTQTVVIPGIRAGNTRLQAWAYTSLDGTGEAIAQAQTTVVVVQGEEVTAHLVLAALPFRVEVTPSPLSLEKSKTGKLTATVYDVDGNIILGTFTFNWSSDNEGVAKVDDSGAVLAVDKGSCKVSAQESVSGKTGSADVNVWVATAATATIEPARVILPMGRTADLTATAYDNLGAVIPYAMVQTWSVDDPSIAGITGTGNQVKVTLGPTAGTTTVRADFGGGLVATCKVTCDKSGTIRVILE